MYGSTHDEAPLPAPSPPTTARRALGVALAFAATLVFVAAATGSASDGSLRFIGQTLGGGGGNGGLPIHLWRKPKPPKRPKPPLPKPKPPPMPKPPLPPLPPMPPLPDPSVPGGTCTKLCPQMIVSLATCLQPKKAICPAVCSGRYQSAPSFLKFEADCCKLDPSKVLSFKGDCCNCAPSSGLHSCQAASGEIRVRAGDDDDANEMPTLAPTTNASNATNASIADEATARATRR